MEKGAKLVNPDDLDRRLKVLRLMRTVSKLPDEDQAELFDYIRRRHAETNEDEPAVKPEVVSKGARR